MTTMNIYDMTDTWNDGGVTFTAIEMDVTDTASAAASKLLELLVGGSSKFKVAKNGDVTALGFYMSTNTGILESTGALALFAGGGQRVGVSSSGLSFRSTNGIGWNNVDGINGSADIFLGRDAAGALAQRNGTTAQSQHLYDTFASLTDYHRLALKTARATLSGVTGASVTATGLIPDGAVLVGLTSKVTTGLGTTNGTTGYQLGDGSDADRWGAAAAVIAGTTTDNRDWTAGTIQAFTSAQDVVVTAVGGNFDGTGVIYLSAQYLIGQAD